MEKDLEGALVNSAGAKLEGSKKPLMDLGDHLEYIESLLEQGTGGDAVKDVKVNGASVIEGKVADIKLKTINNEPVLGDGNISVVTMADVNGAIEAAIGQAVTNVLTEEF